MSRDVYPIELDRIGYRRKQDKQQYSSKDHRLLNYEEKLNCEETGSIEEPVI
ncbi:hypothetical protein CASFOL_039064 [Castilleja foliolosa]|uniref:Uncharacterized protein n=1 Tax=Castilleja foliolosa TaxID=1961234 RepID=A0ABD3BGY4_9LAMI